MHSPTLVAVAATAAELAPLLPAQAVPVWPQRLWASPAGQPLRHYLATGPGTAPTAYWLGRHLALFKPAFALNVGVCGAFRRSLPLASVVQVVQDAFADLGAWDVNGSWLDMAQLGLPIGSIGPEPLYNTLANPTPLACGLAHATGITVESVSGYGPEIARRTQRWNADVETMEGAAFFYTCLQAQVPFAAIRAVSNYVEPRNRAAWQLSAALQALGNSAVQIIEHTV